MAEKIRVNPCNPRKSAIQTTKRIMGFSPSKRLSQKKEAQPKKICYKKAQTKSKRYTK